MRRAGMLLGLLALPLAAQEAWRQPYEGEAASGPQVLALYQFKPGAELRDNSGRKHDLTIRGDLTKVVAAGPLPGLGALQAVATVEAAEKPGGAVTPDAADLTPSGAFCLELWFRPDPAALATASYMLVDKKYINYDRDLPDAHQDYCLFLRRSGEQQQLAAHLGFGNSSEMYTSQLFKLVPGEWIHFAFTYNGSGIGRFYLNGQPAGRRQAEGRGAVADGKHPLVIGDRVGSSYQGAPGRLGQVRLSAGIPPAFEGSVDLTADRGRRVFQRFEPGAKVLLTLVSDLSVPLREVRVTATQGGSSKQLASLPTLSPGTPWQGELPVDTTLRPGDYPLQVVAVGASAVGAKRVELTVPVAVMPRQPDFMPVILWGADPSIKEAQRIGFTDQISTHADYARVWRDGEKAASSSPDDVATKRAALDDLLRAGMGGVGYIHEPLHIERTPELLAQFRRVERDGKPVEPPAVCALFPAVVALSRNTGRALGADYGDHPAFRGCLIHSEMRDHTALCFHEHDAAACRAATGADIPAQAVTKWGVRYTSLPGFPANRVVPDNHPLLTFYRWFWKSGDGWNPLHTATHEGLQRNVRPGFYTWYDPVTRVPSIWGSGGNCDIASTWTYSYPDPLKLGLTCDQVIAMADGGRRRAMKMTQAIWYRSGTAPKLPENEADRASWEREQPDAQFITIAPDHLREALWCKLARPIEGIMYHGWASLSPDGTHGAYRCTNLETKEVLAQLTREVVRPYGPALRQIPDGPQNVALLESFTSQMLAGRGGYGWGEGWEADVHLIAQWAQLQPKVVYEEHLLRDGLDAYQVLLLPNCDVLPRSVVDRIVAFQNRGGLVIGDRNLCPAIVPDMLLPTYTRTKQADVDKTALQKLAAGLRTELDTVFTRYLESDNPDVVCRRRRAGQADYLFVINDQRRFGKYVGHHGRVMEEGLPSSATITVRRPRAVVYDALARQVVATKTVPGGVSFTTKLGPGEGRLYVLLDQRLPLPTVAAGNAERGGKVTVTVKMQLAGQPLAAVVPLRVELRDPQNRPAEWEGYYALRDGTWSQPLTLATNDLPGRWTVTVTELIGGAQAKASFTVR
ncbi:MAG: LamG domain-containing protein [Fimbriimonadaceae bacterium]|nr:LamG domain-containing protein [Fimbriimonadaceae bacterium]